MATRAEQRRDKAIKRLLELVDAVIWGDAHVLVAITSSVSCGEVSTFARKGNTMRELVMEFLRAFGLLGPTFRAYQSLRAAGARMRRRGSHRSEKAPDGLPLPPPQLVFQVAGTTDVTWFLDSGKRAADSMRETLRRAGLDIEHFGSILDFGCGCGRVIRHWSSLHAVEVCATDCNRRAVAWCAAHLPFAQFATNRLEPPLRYDDARFDFVYALSVFTHLPEALQLSWMRELSRVLRPAGHLLLTTHGEHYLTKLNDKEREEFRSGRLVVRYEEVAGTNLCNAFHPFHYVQTRLAASFEVVDFVPEGAKGNPAQDVILLRKPGFEEARRGGARDTAAEDGEAKTGINLLAGR